MVYSRVDSSRVDSMLGFLPREILNLIMDRLDRGSKFSYDISNILKKMREVKPMELYNSVITELDNIFDLRKQDEIYEKEKDYIGKEIEYYEEIYEGSDFSLRFIDYDDYVHNECYTGIDLYD